MISLSALDKAIINEFQRGLPLSHAPFADMAQVLGVNETQVMDAVKRLQQDGVISRLGAVFDHCRAGASTLAAVRVPDDQVERVAAKINALPEVNHNYQREHEFNLWFVVTAPDFDQLQRVLDTVEQWVDGPLLRLPMHKAHHIDLGFNMQWADDDTDQHTTTSTQVDAGKRTTA